MNDFVWQIILCVATAAAGWFFSKLHTRRETNKDDLELISEAVSNALKSADTVIEHNNKLIVSLANEQKKVLELTMEKNALLQDKINLSAKVEALSRKIERQNKEIAELSALVKQKIGHDEKNSDNI